MITVILPTGSVCLYMISSAEQLIKSVLPNQEMIAYFVS